MSSEGKGGDRVQIYPDQYVRAKGMGLHDHYITLDYANSVTNFSTQDLVNFCNTQFGRYGSDARDETCRSWCKELWRYGWLEQIDKKGNTVDLNPTNWKNGPTGRKFRITNEGRRIVGLPKECFIEEVAYVLVKITGDGMYSQCKRILDSLENGINCPIDYEKGPDAVSVVKDTYKAITFGDLEPTGIIFRRDTENWGLHQEYLAELRRRNE